MIVLNGASSSGKSSIALELQGLLPRPFLAFGVAIARDDVGVIIDEVFLGGRESQDRLRSALGGLRVLWVGVRCDFEVAVARAVARPERTQGMALSQAMIVHKGVQYDLQVDTTTSTALECATTIADYVADR